MFQNKMLNALFFMISSFFSNELLFFQFTLKKYSTIEKLHFSILLDKRTCTEWHLHGAWRKVKECQGESKLDGVFHGCALERGADSNVCLLDLSLSGRYGWLSSSQIDVIGHWDCSTFPLFWFPLHQEKPGHLYTFLLRRGCADERRADSWSY